MSLGHKAALETPSLGMPAETHRDACGRHGITPEWESRPNPDATPGRPTRRTGALTSACREALKRIDLHVHDLRREFACALLESSADLHDVRDFLGHANITTTSRYLQSAPIRLEQALARLEQQAEGFAQDSHTGAPEASRETAQAAGDLPRKSLN